LRNFQENNNGHLCHSDQETADFKTFCLPVVDKYHEIRAILFFNQAESFEKCLYFTKAPEKEYSGIIHQ
jgi:hypothetical protein